MSKQSSIGTCPTCGHTPLSLNAESCPTCGERYFKKMVNTSEISVRPCDCCNGKGCDESDTWFPKQCPCCKGTGERYSVRLDTVDLRNGGVTRTHWGQGANLGVPQDVVGSVKWEAPKTAPREAPKIKSSGCLSVLLLVLGLISALVLTVKHILLT